MGNFSFGKQEEAPSARFDARARGRAENRNMMTFLQTKWPEKESQSFAEAFNAQLALIETGWTLWLDRGEVIALNGELHYPSFLLKTTNNAFLLKVVNDDGSFSYENRLFRTDRWRFVGGGTPQLNTFQRIGYMESALIEIQRRRTDEDWRLLAHNAARHGGYPMALGDIALSQGQPVDALRYYWMAGKKTALTYAALIKQCLVMAENPTAANLGAILAIAQQARTHNATRTEAYELLAWALTALGDAKNAKVTLSECPQGRVREYVTLGPQWPQGGLWLPKQPKRPKARPASQPSSDKAESLDISQLTPPS